MNRCENYLTSDYPKISNDILYITMAVDTQNDRLEYKLKGWGQGYESWLLEDGRIFGDTETEGVFYQLEKLYDEKVFVREDGIELKAKIMFVDSGGGKGRSQAVYSFANMGRNRKGIYAIKGYGGQDKPGIINKSKVGPKGKPQSILVNLGVDSLKEMVYSRLLIKVDGPKYMHFTKAYCDYEYFNMLTAEEIKKIPTATGYKRIWQLKKGLKRNEALDLEAYSIAAVMYMNVNFDKLERNLAKVEQKVVEEVVEAEPVGGAVAEQKRLQRKANVNNYKINSWGF
jgi:phage terminase large subunit GpA-like protein